MIKSIFVGLFVLAALTTANCSDVEPQQEAKAGPLCEICTIVMSAAENLLQQNKTEDEIVTFLDKNLCGRLGSLNATCVQYLNAYGKIVIYELSQKIDPSVVCHGIGLCATKPRFTAPIELPTVSKNLLGGGGLNCTLCKLVFTQVQNLLKNNASEAQIIQLIDDKLCNALGPLSETCKSIMQKYGPVILSDLANEVDPTKLCTLIGMCTPNKQRIQDIIIPKPKVDPIFCTVCEYAIQFLDVELKNNKTEAAIVSALDKVCKLAPSPLRPQCDTIVNTYGIYLVQFIIQLADPVKVCQEIKLC